MKSNQWWSRNAVFTISSENNGAIDPLGQPAYRQLVLVNIVLQTSVVAVNPYELSGNLMKLNQKQERGSGILEPSTVS